MTDNDASGKTETERDAEVSRRDALKSRLFGINPEFARNLIREVTPTRLVTLPAVIFAILLLMFLLEDGKVTEAFMTTAIVIYVALVVLWGTALSGNSVMEEFSGRTWDLQRMTAVGPWAMTWGKYAGATFISWYGGLIVMAAYFAALWSPDIHDKWKYIEGGVLLLVAGMSSHALSLLAALVSAREAGHKAKSSTSTALAFLGAFSLLGMIPAVYNDHTNFHWYYVVISPFLLATCSLLFFTAWMLVGAYRTMRAELQYSNGPGAWMVFLLALLVYTSGFVSVEGSWPLAAVQHVTATVISFTLVCVALVYMTAFAEPSGVIEYGRVLKALRRRDRAGFLNEVPLWVVTYCAALALFVVTCVLILFSYGTPAYYGQNQGLEESPRYIVSLGAALLMFVLRDLMILTLLRFSEKPRHTWMSFSIALTALYLIVPNILNSSGARVMTIFFWPPIIQESPGRFIGLEPVLAALCEAALVFYLVRRRYRRVMAAAAR
jgi:hypothetical protein